MKILFLSGWGSAVPLAMHCEESGHEIKFWIEDKDSKDVGEGFVKHVDDYKSHISWADLVITDDTHLGKVNDSIRERDPGDWRNKNDGCFRGRPRPGPETL